MPDPELVVRLLDGDGDGVLGAALQPHGHLLGPQLHDEHVRPRGELDRSVGYFLQTKIIFYRDSAGISHILAMFIHVSFVRSTSIRLPSIRFVPKLFQNFDLIQHAKTLHGTSLYRMLQNSSTVFWDVELDLHRDPMVFIPPF